MKQPLVWFGLFAACAIFATTTSRTFAFPGEPAAAKTPALITSMTPAQAEKILKSFGLEFKEAEPGMYVFRHEGLRLLFHNGEQTLLLYSDFPKGKLSLEKINEWNRSKRFAKAYLNDRNEPTLTADLELSGGVTEKNVMEWLKTYVAYLKQFKELAEGRDED